jgi:hypothetical protein
MATKKTKKKREPIFSKNGKNRAEGKRKLRHIGE